MKKVFTFQKWSSMLILLTAMLFSSSSWAQKSSGAKCADFTATISNGSVLNLCTGASITLNGTPATTGFTFQWQVQTTAGGPFNSISGGTSANYATSNLGAYRVIINTGSCKDTSGITSLIRLVVQGGTISAPSTVICQGALGGLITGSAVPGSDLGIITFAWEKSDNGTTWTAIPGAVDLSYSAGAISQTTYFRRVAMDNCGNKAYSNTVTLSTAAALQAGSITPMSQTITRAQTAAPITSATGASGGSGNYTYQWQSSLFDKGTFRDIVGATASSYQPPHLDETTYFRRVAKDVQCGNTVMTDPAVVFVSDGILNAGAFNMSSSCIFPGGMAAPLITVYNPRGGTPPYQTIWQSSPDNATWSDIAGATGATYQPSGLTQTTWFRKKVTDAAGTIAFSGSEKITLISTPLTAGSIKSSTNVACLGSNPAKIESNGSPTGYGEKLSYQWQYWTASSGVWTDIPNQIKESLIPDPITEKTRFRRAVKDACGQNSRMSFSNEIEIDIRPALVAGDIAPTSQVVRPNQTPDQLTNVTGPTGGTGSYSLSWESAPLAVGPFVTVASQTGLSYQPPAQTQSMYYRRAVKDNGCLATKYTYIVEVYLNSAATINGGSLSGSGCVFPGGTPGLISNGSIPVSGGTPPYTYTWEMSTTAGIWNAIAGATSSSYQPTAITQTTQYRRKVTDVYGEFGYSNVFTVTLTTTQLNGGTIAAQTTVTCSGTTPGMITSVTGYSGNGGSPMYQWQSQVVGGAWTSIAGATVDTYQPGTITQKTYFRRMVTDMCADSSRIAYSNTVVIDLPVSIPLKGGLVDGPFITCAGTAPGLIRSVLDGCGSNVTLSYQWEVANAGNWITITTGATSASYSPPAINTYMKYRRKVMDACGNIAYSNIVEIYVYPPIVAGVIGSDQNVCGNATPDMIRLLTNCHYTDGTVTYQWQKSTTATGTFTNIAGATSNSYQPAASTASSYYRLMVKSTTCNATMYTNTAAVIVGTCRVSNSSSLSPAVQSRAAAPAQTQLSGSDMTVYPNPLTGNSVEVQMQTKGKVNVRLMNAEGRMLPVTVSHTGSGLMKVNFGTVTPARGMYILSVNDANGTHTQKVIVE